MHDQAKEKQITQERDAAILQAIERYETVSRALRIWRLWRLSLCGTMPPHSHSRCAQ